LEASEIERQWAVHTWDGFPREILLKPSLENRTMVRNFDVFKWYMWRAFGGQSSYVEVYPDSAKLSKNVVMTNKIYIDFDKDVASGVDLPVVYDEMRALVRYFRQEYDYTPRVYFSGSKGFAVYLDFEPVLLEHFSETMRVFHSNLVRDLHLRTMDTMPIGDDRRVSRVPYTYHHVSELLCVPIVPEWPLSNILASASEPNGIGTIPINIINCKSLLPDRLKEIDSAVNTVVFTPRELNEEEKTDQTTRYYDEVSEMFDLAPRYAEGRTRTLWAMLAPRLAWVLSNGKYKELSGENLEAVNNKILSSCREWIELTPGTDPDGKSRKATDSYLRYVSICLKQQKRDIWHPWNKETFWITFPELSKYWIHQ
jgi:hypothetical protein